MILAQSDTSDARIDFAPNSLPFPARANNSLRWQKKSLLCLRREFGGKRLNSQMFPRRIFPKSGLFGEIPCAFPCDQGIPRARRCRIDPRRAAKEPTVRKRTSSKYAHPPRGRGNLPRPQSFTLRSRSALPMTLTDESAIAAAAITGDSVRPKTG